MPRAFATAPEEMDWIHRGAKHPSRPTLQHQQTCNSTESAHMENHPCQTEHRLVAGPAQDFERIWQRQRLRSQQSLAKTTKNGPEARSEGRRILRVKGRPTQSGAFATRVLRLKSELAVSFFVSQNTWTPRWVNTAKTG